MPGPGFCRNQCHCRSTANKKVKGQPRPKRGNTKQKKKPVSRKSSSQPRSQGFQLAHCSKLYAQAIGRPFATSEGVCIPSGSGPSRPSQKVRSTLRFVASVGSTASNFGFVLISPSLANDNVCVTHSNASYAATTTAFYNQPASEYTQLSLPLPYRKAELKSGDGFSSTASVQGRIVSLGVRWRYVGTELNRGGRTYALTHPDHDNLYGCSFASLGAFRETISSPPSRTWSEAVVYSNTAAECDYPRGLSAIYSSSTVVVTQEAQEELTCCYPLSSQQFMSSDIAAPYTANSVVGGAPLAIVFDGINAVAFEFEVVIHVEYIGRSTQSFMTKSHSDPVGTAVVLEAANGMGLVRQYGMSQANALMAGITAAAKTQSGQAVKQAGMQWLSAKAGQLMESGAAYAML